MRAASLVALTIGGLLAGEFLSGCSPATIGSGAVSVDTGKYQYHNCAQLLERRKHWADRELELKLLIDEAEQGSGGAFISVIAYQSEHMAAREELKVIEQAATAKNCDKLRRSP